MTAGQGSLDFNEGGPAAADRGQVPAAPGRIIRAMLLAAGQGTRLWPLTESVPKSMLPVAGKPLLQRNVEYLARFGLQEVAINLHHRPEAIMRHFGDGADYGLRIRYSHEPHLLGTAGAVKKLEAFFTETFLVLYSDNLTTCDLDRLHAFHTEKAAVATVALFGRENVGQSGVAELDGNDRIVRFVEKPGAGETASHWVSAGVLVLEPRVLDVIPTGQATDFGRDVLPALLARGYPVYGYCMGQDESLWWIDTPGDYHRVCAIWEGRN